MELRSDRLTTVACAAVLAVLSTAVLGGWIFHLPLLTRVSPTFAPTQFNTALCFLLYSTGFLLASPRRGWLTAALAALICAIGLLTIEQTVFAHSLGIDSAFGYYVRVEGVPARMADATAVVLVCIGIALWICTGVGKLSRFVIAAIATLGSIPLAVAAGALLGFGAGMQSHAGWTGFAQIGLPTVLMCTIAGAHLLWFAWRRSDGDEAWLPIPTFFGLLMLTLTLTQELREDQVTGFTARAQASAQQFADRAHARSDDMFAAFDRMANRWDIGEETAPRIWASSARDYLRDFRGLVALESIDAGGKVRWAVPPLDNPGLIEARLRTEPARAVPAGTARRLNAPQITRVMTLSHGGLGFLYMNPLRDRGGYDGLQIAVVRASDFVAGVFGRADIQRYAISVVANGVPVYSSSGAPERVSEWTRSASFSVHNARWVVRITPSPQLVARALSSLPEVVFGAGCVVSALMSFNVFLALKWRRNMRSLREKEEALERSDERYRVAVEGSGVGLWDFNVLTGELYWSPRYREFLGIGDAAFVPARTEFESRVHREDRAGVFAQISSAIRQGIPYDGEARVRRNDGSYVWLRLRGIPTRDARGNTIRLSGSVDDISALKRAEDELRSSEEIFRVTMDSAPVGIALMSPDKRLLRANRAMAVLLGCSHERELMRVDPRMALGSAYDRDREQMSLLLTGQIDRYEFEHELVTRDGKVIWVLASGSLARNADGSARHIVKQLIDISERKEMERMKGEFISVVSHELRTPLTAIRGSLGLMATAMRTTLPGNALGLVEIANRNCERLMALVDDILDMEKLAANRMPFNSQAADAGHLVRQALEANAAYAEKYNVRLTPDVQSGAAIFVDPNRFAQVLANLLSNAVKFSPQGGAVEVAVRDRDHCVRIEVRDHGAGIPDEFRPRVFGRFMQADSSTSRAKGGTGLGLHITRQLVERMGGQIGFESSIDKGTVFWIAFPVHDAESPLQTSAVA